MNKLTLTALLLLVSFSSLFAQVGIGTTNPDNSSILDISSSSKGLLIPRVQINNEYDRSVINNPARSLIVYNSEKTGTLDVGFYFWNGTIWESFKDKNTANSWGLTGNNTSSSPDSFLGTTSYNNLNFKVNNSNFGSFNPNGGLALGKNAQANTESAIAIGTDTKATSNQNIAIGYNAQATGYNSTSIGIATTATAQNAIAIGKNVTANKDNTIIIGNNVTGWEMSKIGFGTSDPQTKVHIVGDLQLVNGNQGNGKVLISDANGKATWTDLNTAVATTKGFADIQDNGKSSNSLLTFNTNSLTNNLTLSNTTFKFTQPGYYKITYQITDTGNGNRTTNLELRGNDTAIANSAISISANGTQVLFKTKIIKVDNTNINVIYTLYTNANNLDYSNSFVLIEQL